MFTDCIEIDLYKLKQKEKVAKIVYFLAYDLGIVVHRSGFGTNITSKKKKTCSVDMNNQQDTPKQQLEFPLLKFTHYRPFFSKSVSKVVVNDE